MITTQYILDATDALSEIRARGGGKATNLARMQHVGCRVPQWICVSVDAFSTFVESHALAPLLAPWEDLAAWEREVEARFLEHPLPAELEAMLRTALTEHKLHETQVAVRSSGLDEDGVEHSFAGQFSSFLFQQGFEAVSRSLRRCWASGFTERGISYRRERGLQTERIQVGVVIQQMVDADVAGVAFSRNPSDPLDRESVVLSSVWGVGEGLVSGALDADTFLFKRSDGAIERDIVLKTHAFRRDSSGGVLQEPLPAALSEVASLTDAQIKELGQQLVQLEDALGCPQDAEWGLADGTLYMLQTRPITTLPRSAFFNQGVNGERCTLWDNSNIIESYSGVTSPLTFSFASHAYEQVYIQFCEVVGVEQKVIDAHADMFRNMLGLIRGRIYYNLVNWYRLLALLPGATSNASFMETMMGVQKELGAEQQKLFDFKDEIPQTALWRRLRLHLMTLQRFRRMDQTAEDFHAHFNAVYEEVRHIDYQSKSLNELQQIYDSLSERVLKRWQAPIINDYLCMIFFGLLKKLTVKWIANEEEAATLQNDLLCGQGDLESTEPTKYLMRLAASIDQDPAIRTWWLETPSDEIWEQMQHDARFPAIAARFMEFLDRYGFRCVNELKLEENDLHDDPSFAIEAVSGYIRTQSYSVEAMQERERAICQKAEAAVSTKLSGWKRRIYNWVLKHARRAIRHRENLRFARTKIFGVVRHLFRGIGTQFERLGVLTHAQDVFYLTTDEIFSYIEGRSVTLSLQQLVELRKGEFESFRTTSAPPDRFLTTGAVGTAQLYPQVLAGTDLLRDHLPESDDPNVLIGTPCCPGTVEGVVRVVHALEDAKGLDGEILVTARTDPGWVPLYPACSALLIERGSLLSHSAVVARELGLPTIVGVRGGLVERLKTGDRVRVDAAKGEIRLLSD